MQSARYHTRKASMTDLRYEYREWLNANDLPKMSAENLLRHGQPHGSVVIHSPANRPHVRFFPDGSTPGSNASIGLCGRGGPQHARRLVISNIGRIRRDTFPAVDPAHCPA